MRRPRILFRRYGPFACAVLHNNAMVSRRGEDASAEIIEIDDSDQIVVSVWESHDVRHSRGTL